MKGNFSCKSFNLDKLTPLKQLFSPAKPSLVDSDHLEHTRLVLLLNLERNDSAFLHVILGVLQSLDLLKVDTSLRFSQLVGVLLADALKLLSLSLLAHVEKHSGTLHDVSLLLQGIL